MEIKMKPKEAYDLIELCLDYDKGMSDNPDRYDVALQIAREAFYKQIPMKPIPKRAGYGMLLCNVCNCGLEPYNSYCPNCGQSIDWSDE